MVARFMEHIPEFDISLPDVTYFFYRCIMPGNKRRRYGFVMICFQEVVKGSPEIRSRMDCFISEKARDEEIYEIMRRILYNTPPGQKRKLYPFLWKKK